MRIRSVAMAAAVLTLGVPTLRAQSFVFDNSAPFNANSSLTGATDFNQVGGMGVSWVFADGSTGQGVWGALNSPFWGAGSSSNGFVLYGTGNQDTFSNPWGFFGSNLVSFTIQAALGGAVFDANPYNNGSGAGRPFTYRCAGANYNDCEYGPGSSMLDWWGTTVTYSNPVGLNGQPAQPGYYGTMTVAFATPVGQSSSSSNCNNRSGTRNDKWTGCDWVQFYQDLDLVPNATAVELANSTVPEPATMTLLATGLAGMAAARRRRKSA